MGRRQVNKMEKVMSEYKHRKLHAGSKRGPIVKNRKQAVAIALSEQRRKNASKKMHRSRK